MTPPRKPQPDQAAALTERVAALEAAVAELQAKQSPHLVPLRPAYPIRAETTKEQP